ncbi:MAG: hypothetical protein K2W96_25710 [Gemmataceae bacterium]|nr:hypothetical protein [Gemmataceae bacterium]
MNAPQLTVEVNKLTVEIDNLKKRLDAHLDAFKELADSHTKLKEENIHLKRDVEDLEKWKADKKKQEDEDARRAWAFGPNIVGALIAFVGSLILLLINLWITYSHSKRD